MRTNLAMVDDRAILVLLVLQLPFSGRRFLSIEALRL
jgi:hypothetical protein